MLLDTRAMLAAVKRLKALLFMGFSNFFPSCRRSDLHGPPLARSQLLPIDLHSPDQIPFPGQDTEVGTLPRLSLRILRAPPNSGVSFFAKWTKHLPTILLDGRARPS